MSKTLEVNEKDVANIIEWACYFIENRPQREFTDEMDELIHRIEALYTVKELYSNASE